MPRQRLRSHWLKLHRYLGIVLGLPLALIGISGSLIVFAWDLDEQFNRSLIQIERPEHLVARPLEESLAAARGYLPANALPIDWLRLPRQNDQTLRFSYGLTTSVDKFEIFVNPYTARVLGQRLWGDFNPCCSWHGPIMAVVYRFHDSFWLGENGQAIVGGIGLLMLFSLLSGLILWWPNPKKWRTALTLKTKASPQRRIFDWHKLAGTYSFLILAMLFFTGAYMNFPDQSHQIVNQFSSLSVEPDNLKSENSGQMALSIDQALAVAKTYFPNAQFDAMLLPTTVDGVYGFYFYLSNDVAEIPVNTLSIDQFTGKLLYVTDATRKTAGDTFHDWQFGLHSGRALGLTGQLLVLFAGLMPGVLYITGVIRWRQKRRIRRYLGS